MSTCAELNESYRKVKEEIDALKLEIDLEFQKEKWDRDYPLVIRVKKDVDAIVKRFKSELNPIPEYFRGKENVRLVRLEIGGRDAAEIIDELTKNSLSVGGNALSVLTSVDFRKSLILNPDELDFSAQILKGKENMNFIRLTVRDLGFSEVEFPTVKEVYDRALDLGLELCPPEVGPNYVLKFMNELNDSPDDWFYVAMKPIAVPFGGDSLSLVVSNNLAGSPALGTGGSDPNHHLVLDDRYIFAMPSVPRRASVKVDSKK